MILVFGRTNGVRKANGMRKEARTQLTGSKRDQVRGGRNSRSGKNGGGTVEIWFIKTNDVSGAGNTATEGAPVYTGLQHKFPASLPEEPPSC